MPWGQALAVRNVLVVVLDQGVTHSKAVCPYAGFRHGIMHSLALGRAELRLRASAPCLQKEVLLVLFHEVVEADMGTGKSLGLVQCRSENLLQAEILRPFLKADHGCMDGPGTTRYGFGHWHSQSNGLTPNYSALSGERLKFRRLSCDRRPLQ